MKGISMTIETIIYLILAILVLSVLLLFFLSQAGPPQDQFALEAKRNSACGAYTVRDFRCAGKSGSPITNPGDPIPINIQAACHELTRRFNGGYDKCESGPSLECIQQCCMTCPKQA
ncbi:MAG TPA: hypothetical protein HA230_00970 [Candidatus Aenigmarchaeota archaeon]|nr:hypothetical protein [Candidatus Aenigmarchaeota archaeon]